jgi:hypothetical protein
MRSIRYSIAAVLVLLGGLVCAAPALAVPGDVLWADQVFHSGVVGDDIGKVVKVDTGNDPIIAAESATGVSTQELLSWSYTPAGLWRWEGHWDGPGSTFEVVNDMALDGSGTSYTVGSTQIPAEGADTYLVRRDDSGVFSHQSFYNGPANGDDEAMAVTVDASGNAWYTGMSQDVDGDMDVVTVRVDSTGVQAWAKRYNSPYDRFDGGFAIARSGNALYVAGTSNRIGHGDDLLLIRYNATTGARVWVRRYDDTLHRNEFVADVVATANDVYVCGAGKVGAVTAGDAMLARYSSGGVKKWVTYFNGGGGLDEHFVDMQRAPNGTIVVTGVASKRASGQDWVTIAYRPDSTIRWGKTLTSPSPPKRADVAAALDIDANGKIYVTGTIQVDTHGADICTVCYGATGVTQWITDPPWNGADSGDDTPWDIEVAGDGVYVTGSTYVTANGNDMVTIKYEK